MKLKTIKVKLFAQSCTARVALTEMLIDKARI